MLVKFTEPQQQPDVSITMSFEDAQALREYMGKLSSTGVHYNLFMKLKSFVDAVQYR